MQYLEFQDFTHEYPSDSLYELRRATLGLEVWVGLSLATMLSLEEFDSSYSDFAGAQRRASWLLPRKPKYPKWQTLDQEERIRMRR